MTNDTSGAAACPDEKPRTFNAFTQHLDPTHKGVDMKKLDHNARMSRKQTAVVAQHLEEGKNLSLIHSLSRKAPNKRYFAPVQGREATQKEADLRASKSLKARI